MNQYFNGISVTGKIALISFILGKLLSFPAAITILMNKKEASLFLYSYAFFIFISIIFSLISKKGNKKENVLPDGVFHLDGITLKIKDGNITEYKNNKSVQVWLKESRAFLDALEEDERFDRAVESKFGQS